jgi:hypothetical protein
MDLHYHKDWRGNFGDDLNLPFFNFVAPELGHIKSTRKLYGIGTLLNNVHGPIANAIIFGSGFGYGRDVEWDRESVSVLGVRGPITARALGIPAELVIGDPALYLPKIQPLLLGSAQGRGQVLVATHHRTNEMWDLRGEQEDGFFFLDPGMVSIADYVASIRSAPLVLTESLHGAIVASAFGVPFIPISLRTQLEPTKWADFAQSVALESLTVARMPLPKDVFGRRVAISAARRIRNGRRLFGTGRQLDPARMRALTAALKAQIRDGRRLVVAAPKVRSLQDKIEGACVKLRDLMAKCD